MATDVCKWRWIIQATCPGSAKGSVGCPWAVGISGRVAWICEESACAATLRPCLAFVPMAVASLWSACGIEAPFVLWQTRCQKSGQIRQNPATFLVYSLCEWRLAVNGRLIKAFATPCSHTCNKGRRVSWRLCRSSSNNLFSLSHDRPHD